ncbi:secretin and TonB N-terminal domain-containing protein, partial [bacterium]|nr:secretin and TonB N-terminal domain-containing protein [bacterium]
MRHNLIKKYIAAALLLAFTSPVGLAVSTYNAYSNYSGASSVSSTKLSGDVKLTQSNEKITLSLRDSDVKQVLRMFADKAGMNIVFHDSVDGKVTLDLVNTPINDAFNLVLQIAGLSYYTQDNTMIVLSSSSEANASFSKQEMMVFPVQYVNAVRIADFLNKNVFGMKKTGLSGVDAATVNSATNELIVFGMPSDA